MSDDDCQPSEYPCWQHYGEHNAGQPVTQWVLDLAESYMRFRMRSMPSTPTFDEAWKVREAIDLYNNLQGKRWRDMNREPFSFNVGEGTDSFVTEPEVKERAVSLLETLGLIKPKVPMRRRV